MTDTAVEAPSGQRRYVLVELGGNHNKFWHAWVEGETFVTEWGRVGERGNITRKPYPSVEKAQKAFESKCREKERKGYTLQRTAGSGYKAPVVGDGIAELARAQIKGCEDVETARLVEFLVKRNIHAIEGATGVRLDQGKLTTPLGPVTAEGVAEAEVLLDRIGQAILNHNMAALRAPVDGYLRIVPRSLGRRRLEPSDVFPDMRSVQREVDTLEAIRQALADANRATVNEAPSVFRTHLNVIAEGSQEWERTLRLYLKTINRKHVSANFRMKRIWEVSVGPADDKFESGLQPVERLWHGTKDANLLSILRGGYVIPNRSSSVQITGRMFGDGVYFSDQSTKSLNYATGFWSGGQSSARYFMLLNDVAMGKIYRPSRRFSGTPPHGYDSAYVRGGTAGVINNESIVYRATQCRPVRLCEFGR